MTATAQSTLRLPMPPATVTLIPLDMAAALAGIHLDHALERVESGEWRWAFDLAAGHERRTLHLWRGCLDPTPEQAGTCFPTLDELRREQGRTAARRTVIDAAIGTPVDEVRLVSLETRWSVRAQTIRRWLAAKEIGWRRGDHTLWLSRAGLAAFLERRLAA